MAFIAKQRYKLDIAPKGGWVIVYASQHDDGAREIEFEITNQGRAFSIPASINVSVQGIKSNGSYFSHSCSYSGNVVTMALADDMTDIVGKAICVLKLTNSSQQKLATAKFVLNVDSDSSSEGVIIDIEAEEIFNQMLNEIRAQASAISVDIAELQSMVGSPLVASTASEMTDHNKIYVYVGSETGYINGNWYYWNGSAWTSGGVYNSTAFETDKTLSVEDMPADAKVVGDEIEGIKGDFNANPFVSKSFVVPIGTIHLSTSNWIDTDIKAGQSFAVIVESSETGSIIVVGYGDETTKNLSTLDYKGVAEKDIVYIGVYYDNRSGVSDVAIKFCIAKNPYGYDAVYAGSQVGNIINDIARLDNSIFKQSCPLNRLYSDDGIWINHARYSATELISINPPVNIKVNVNIPSGYHAVILYDSEQNVIGTKITNVNTTGIIETITESNCAYIRFQGRNLNFSGNLIDPTIYVYSSVNDRIVEAEKKTDNTNQITLTKTSATEFNIKIPCESGKVVRYDFRKDYKKWDSLDYVDGNGVTQQVTNIVSSDLWNNYYVYNDSTGAYIAQGHSNFIIKKDDHYVGNGHGNEVAITFDILANGKVINIDALITNETIECGELRIIAKTKMFRSGGNTGSDVPAQAYPALDTSGNPIVDFIHCMDISYNVGNKILMQNKLIVQNDDTVLQECNGAMLECYFVGFSKVIVNNAENTQNNVSSDGTVTVADGSTVNLRTTPSVYANTVEMFGINHYIKQSMLNDDSPARQKSAVTFVFYSNRLKSYFTPVATQSRYPSGQTADTFNEGDVISVTNERIIEI